MVIKTAYSSVNYKDALAGTGQENFCGNSHLVGGIDVAGHVVASTDAAFKEGDAALVTGSGLSGKPATAVIANMHGWMRSGSSATHRAEGLREAMILGTAGFTAALGLLDEPTGKRRRTAPWQSPVPVAAWARWR